MDTFIILYSKFSEVSKNFINYILKKSIIKFKFLCLDFIKVREKIVEILGINELPCVIIIRNDQLEIYSGKDAYKLSEEMSRQLADSRSEFPKEKLNKTMINTAYDSTQLVDGDAVTQRSKSGGRGAGEKRNRRQSPSGNGRTILYDLSDSEAASSFTSEGGGRSAVRGDREGRSDTRIEGGDMPDHGEAASGDDIDQESMMELISETERQSYVNSTIQDKNKNNGKRPLVGIRKNAGNYEYDTKEF